MNESDNKTANKYGIDDSRSRNAVNTRDDNSSRDNSSIIDVISSRPPE
jgi:hypothetical protein